MDTYPHLHSFRIFNSIRSFITRIIYNITNTQ